MVKHIVMWKLKEQAHGNSKMVNARLIKEKLESLNGKIPGMLKLEVGADFSGTNDSFDVALYSEFKSKDDLNNYQNHPEHRAIMPFVAEAREERRVVDYES
ncbi:MAG TPA: Dabb family protein [Candidatus Acidoferrales bacterium]|nr:Dabb family protein [Candidatus Acidoferrales bacterium]